MRMMVLLLLVLPVFAQTPAPQHGSLSVQEVYELLLGVQLEARVRPEWAGKVRLTLIAPKVEAKVMEALDKLAHGWADCSKAIVGLGCNMIPPITVQVITTQASQEHWRLLAELRWYKDDLVGRPVAAEVWVLPGEVKGGVMVLESPTGDHVLTGPPLTGLAGRVAYYKASGIGAVLRKQMKVEELVKGARRWMP